MKKIQLIIGMVLLGIVIGVVAFINNGCGSSSSYSHSNSGLASYYDGLWTGSGGKYSIELNSENMTAVVNWPKGKNVHCEWDVISAKKGVIIGPCATVDYPEIFFFLLPDGTAYEYYVDEATERKWKIKMSRRK